MRLAHVGKEVRPFTPIPFSPIEIELVPGPISQGLIFRDVIPLMIRH